MAFITNLVTVLTLIVLLYKGYKYFKDNEFSLNSIKLNVQEFNSQINELKEFGIATRNVFGFVLWAFIMVLFMVFIMIMRIIYYWLVRAGALYVLVSVMLLSLYHYIDLSNIKTDVSTAFLETIFNPFISTHWVIFTRINDNADTYFYPFLIIMILFLLVSSATLEGIFNEGSKNYNKEFERLKQKLKDKNKV